MTFQIAFRYCQGNARQKLGRKWISEHISARKVGGKTHVGLDVEVLEVERVLPDVDADDGDVGQERVLVGSRRQLKTLGGRVQALLQTVSRP